MEIYQPCYSSTVVVVAQRIWTKGRETCPGGSNKYGRGSKKQGHGVEKNKVRGFKKKVAGQKKQVHRQ